MAAANEKSVRRAAAASGSTAAEIRIRSRSNYDAHPKGWTHSKTNRPFLLHLQQLPGKLHSLSTRSVLAMHFLCAWHEMLTLLSAQWHRRKGPIKLYSVASDG